MSDDLIPGEPPQLAHAPQRKTYEAWAAEKKPVAWLIAAGRVSRGWAIGREVTEAEFDAAIQAAGAVQIGS